MSTPVRATCHCGGVELSALLIDGLSTAIRCDCSYCSRRGAVMVAAKATHVTIVKGAELLTEYRFGTNTARHYFCSRCGIYTHHQRRSDPTECGVNAGCIEGLHLPDLDPVPWTDGRNHPSDI